MKSINHLFLSLRYSLAGLRACFRDEVAFRQECVLGLVHFVALVLLPLTIGVRFVLVSVWVLLVVVELLNTAIESVVDLVSPQRHPLAAKAKDCASAAVFCMLLLLMACWILAIICYLH